MTDQEAREVAVPKGMTAWSGGDDAPDDWDGGFVLFRNGTLVPGCDFASWAHWRWESLLRRTAMASEWRPIAEAKRDGSFEWIGRGDPCPFADYLRWWGGKWRSLDDEVFEERHEYGTLYVHPLPPAPTGDA